MGAGAASLPAFRAAFVTIGVLTVASAGIFWQLADEQPPAPGSAERATRSRELG